jgi:uncharacterized repeat protein (TIGR01451 family)
MAQLHRTLTLWPLLGLACLPPIAVATESNDKAGAAAQSPSLATSTAVASGTDKSKLPGAEWLPLCTPGLAKNGGAEAGALGLYDVGGGLLAADEADAESAAKCLKGTPGNLSLDIGDISLNLNGGVQYLGLGGSAQRVIRAVTNNPALCESYYTRTSPYVLELRNSNNDIQGPSGQMPGVDSLSYQLSARAFEPALNLATYGPWVRCFDATLANAPLATSGVDALFGAGFETSADLRVEYLDSTGAAITSGEMVSTIGSNSVYKVRVTNRGEVAATSVRVREFLPRASGPLTPTMTAVSCVNETASQNCNVDTSGALLQNIASLAPGASVTFAMTRAVAGSTPVAAEIGALTSVAAFVDPDAVAERNQRDNSRHLRIGLVTNGLPVANGGARTTNEDTAFSITLSGSDPDGDALVTWTVSTPPAHGALSGTAPNLTYTPAADYFGPDSFSYRVTDDEGGTSLPATVAITINPINDGPRVATQLGNVSYAEGANVEIDASTAFVDPEGDAFTVGVTGLPAGVQYFAGLRAIAGTLGLSSSGNYTVVLTATETATSLTAQQQFTLAVSNTNQNPTIATPIPDRNNAEGDVVSTSIAANFADADVGDTLSFSVSAGALPPGLSLAANGQITGTISQTAAAGSAYSVTIRADDGQSGTIDDSFLWTVTPVNAAPQATGSIPNQTDTVGTSFLMSGSLVTGAFVEPDGDTLEYSATGLPAGVFIDETSGTIFGSTSVTGVYAIVVTATDPGLLTATQAFTITINP